MGETRLNVDQWRDLWGMYRREPVINVAVNSFLSMVVCGPFKFEIPKLNISSNGDMSLIIKRYWLPWQRGQYTWLMVAGVVPYWFVLPSNKSSHQIPMIPDPEMGYITVSVNERTHRKQFRWYWTHGTTIKEEKRMLWITKGQEPTMNGDIISPLSSLLGRYRSLLILKESQDDASTQAAHPPHLFEFHPPKGSSGQDDLTHLKAQFGEKAAGLAKARKQQMQEREMRVRSRTLHNQLKKTYLNNRGVSEVDPAMRQVLWTDTPEEVVRRHNPALHERAVALPADYKYTSAAKPALLGDYEKSLATFNMMAAAVVGFPLEMIQPTGSARTQNIQGSIRFVNEAIKEWLNFLEGTTQTALIVAWREKFDNLFSHAKRRAFNRKGGDPDDIASAYPEVDVKVVMQCTPLMSYEELSQMHMDGLMSKDTFADHAFHMRALPMSQKEVTAWPDKVPKELLVKSSATTNNKSTTKDVSESKKKKKKDTTTTTNDNDGTKRISESSPTSDDASKSKKAKTTIKSTLTDPATKTSVVRTVNK